MRVAALAGACSRGRGKTRQGAVRLATIEVQNINLHAEFNDEPAAVVTFKITPEDAKAAIEPFELAIGVPHLGDYAQTVDRAFRAMHRLVRDLDEKLRPRPTEEAS